MSDSYDSISEPFPISLINNCYLVFDVDVVTYLRRTHHICGTFIGGIPQAPQQNVFHGLPLQLMPEEARLLVKKEIAYIVDDAAWHRQNFTLEGDDKKEYLESLRAVGLEARKFSEVAARKKSEMAKAKYATRPSKKSSSSDLTDADIGTDPLFTPEERPSSQAPNTRDTKAESKAWAATPTTSYPPSSLPTPQGPNPAATSAYPLFAHLHSKNYYIMPGLRFGCNFNVYPGDPLRFHSHFLAVGYDWNEEISMLDLIGGGRLGTRVKKGFLIGGKDDEERNDDDDDNVRAFCIEWGGM